MTDRLTHDDINAAIDRDRQDWRQVVQEVGPDRMEQPGVMGNWTFKDLAAHLTGWHEHTIRHLDAAAMNESDPDMPWPADLTEIDEINDWIYQKNRDRPADEVLQEADASYDRLASAVQRFSEDELNDPGRIKWLKGKSLASTFKSGDMFGHFHEEHAEDVQAFLNRDE